eukprot:1158419-Pelagomonas_calceolata.AAC.8
MGTSDQESLTQPPKPLKEEEAAESNSDSGDEEGNVTEGGSTTDSSSSSKKKKKKKKNKKKKEGGEAEQHQQQPGLSKQERAALEKKFQEALSTIKDSDDLWLNLSGSLIQDGKVEKVGLCGSMPATWWPHFEGMFCALHGTCKPTAPVASAFLCCIICIADEPHVVAFHPIPTESLLHIHLCVLHAPPENAAAGNASAPTANAFSPCTCTCPNTNASAHNCKCSCWKG